MDKFTIRSLELLQPMQDDGSSLLQVIDKTVSPMGARMLKRWIVFPLKDQKPINERLDIVEYLFREPEFRQCIDDQFHLIGDLERIISKVAVGRVSPREVVQLKVALKAIQPVKTACLCARNDSLKRIGEQLNLCELLRERIAKEIQNDPPQLVNKGGVIADGVNEELDELRHIAYSGKDYLMKIQERETQETGISSLKIGYNNVFGYYLEVRNTYKDKVPASWDRNSVLKRFSGTAVVKNSLTVRINSCKLEGICNIILVRAVENRRCYLPVKCSGCSSEVNLEELSDIHT